MAELARLPPDIHHLVAKFSNPKLYLLWYNLPLDDHDHLILLGAYTDINTCIINLLSHLYIKIDPVLGTFPGQPHLYTPQGWIYHYPKLSDFVNWQSHKEITDIDDFVITEMGSNEFMNNGYSEQKWIRVVSGMLVRTSPSYSIYDWKNWADFEIDYAVPKNKLLEDPKVEFLKLDIPALISFRFSQEDQYLVDSPLTMILLLLRGIHPYTPKTISKKLLDYLHPSPS